jgi:hypothetical protein
MPSGRPQLPDRTAETYAASTGRAGAIIRGLLRCHKARPRRISATRDRLAEFVRLERLGMPGYFYWISRDGSKILAGRGLVGAEPLQPGFLYAMERAGAMPQKT